MNKFKGRNALLLQEYFDLKVKLGELQTMKRFRISDNLETEILNTEKSIIEILSGFDKSQLLQIIHMSLDVDYEKLVDEGVVANNR